MDDLMIKIDNVSKMYKLGQIGGTTLREELQRKAAKLRGKEDPTKKIGAKDYNKGETFMALNGVSFEVKKGERVGIIGHNGAGKSTLLKLLSRVTAPTDGEIGLNGRVASMLEVGTGFHGELTGRENIYMNGAILGMTKKEIDAKMEDIIEFSECRQFIDTPVKRYSSGMYVKLAFSVAAHLDSEILIMDEVLAVGDMAFQKKCLDKMNDVSKSEGRTILYVSHNMNTIRQLCDRVVVLDHGKVVFDGGVEEGIGIYLGIQSRSSDFLQLDTIEREPDFVNHTVTMSYLKVNNFRDCYEIGSKIEIEIGYFSKRTYENASFRAVIKSVDGTPITMMASGKDLQIKEEGKIIFDLDISRLVPGRYTVSPIFFRANQYGGNDNLDVLRDVYCFEIITKNGFNNEMIWEPNYWGYVFNSQIIFKEL